MFEKIHTVMLRQVEFTLRGMFVLVFTSHSEVIQWIHVYMSSQADPDVLKWVMGVARPCVGGRR